MMTVKDLKKKLEHFPDDAPVLVATAGAYRVGSVALTSAYKVPFSNGGGFEFLTNSTTDTADPGEVVEVVVFY